MPWNDNAGPGPWGSPPPSGDKPDGDRPKPGPRRPSGGGPRGPGGPTPIDFADLSQRLSGRLRDAFNGPGRPRAFALVAAGVVGLWALSGIYVVQPDQQAVVTTFGAYSRTASSGLRYHLPYPIERAEKVSVTSLQRIDIGGVPGAPLPDESLMLTGDENIVDLSFSVQYRIADPARYLFSLRDPDAAIKAVAESAMREVIGKTALQPILTTARGQVQDQAGTLTQAILDRYGAGVFIDSVQIRAANPPPPVIAAFQDVNTASQNAESNANVARGEAAKIKQAAIGYREQVVREAAGEAARFNQVYDQYKLAPAVTRERLYIETMQRVLANSNKVVVDSKGASAPIILPPDAFRPKASTARITSSSIPGVN
ncbi:MAG: HflK protein [Caulobacter sp.]|nr:HflK protein [Caulobacter sp.]